MTLKNSFSKALLLSLVMFSFFTTPHSFGQTIDHAKFIELGKIYKNFMFRNEPTKEVLKDLKKDIPNTFTESVDFIAQTITTDNKLLTKSFLTVPVEQTLKQIYIIRAINLNLREEDQIDNSRLIDSLVKKDIPRYELVDNYYDMLFAAVGNKNQPFDFSKVDFKLKEYNLNDDTEKGIFFLRSMDYCGKEIWGYMNIVKPANTREAYKNVKRFPRFNGQPYYQYTDFYFPDFEMNIIKDKGLQSYKGYYIDNFYETLLSHLICLNKEGRTEKEKNDLLLGSILKDRALYKYTKHKETLEKIFKEQTKE